MGKGFNNYMCKKFFHPASRDNLKRVWMAEQQAEAYKKKQEELRNQYEKEQDLHDNKAMLSRESKDKLSMNFMYEPPPGVRKEKEDTGSEYKFEWQRIYNAPRESYCKGDTEIRDQPFGIQVRNVRCIKCHKWGHINTDKECTMYSISMSEAKKIHSETEANTIMSKSLLEEQMKEDGLAMKKNMMSPEILQKHSKSNINSYIKTEQTEEAFLRSLSKEQKKKLLKKLEKLEKLNKKKNHKKVSKYNHKTSSPKRSAKRTSPTFQSERSHKKNKSRHN